MNEDFEFAWWQKIMNKFGLGGFLAIVGIISVAASVLIGGGIFYAAVKFIVAH
jgi:hypothetical protein